MRKNAFCPNLNHPHAQALINKLGLRGFYRSYIENNYEIPVPEEVHEAYGKQSKVSRVNSDLTSFLTKNPNLTSEDFNIYVKAIEDKFEDKVFISGLLRSLNRNRELTSADKAKLVEDNASKIVDKRINVVANLKTGGNQQLEITKFLNNSYVVYAVNGNGSKDKLGGFKSDYSNAIESYLEQYYNGGTIQSELIPEESIKRRKALIFSEESLKNTNTALIEQVKSLYKLYSFNKTIDRDNLTNIKLNPTERNNFKSFVSYLDISEQNTSVADMLMINKELFNAIQQSEIVDNITALMYDELLSEGAKDAGKVNIRKIFDIVYNRFQESYLSARQIAESSDNPTIKEKANILADRYENVFKHFPEFYELASNALMSNGFKISDNRSQQDKFIDNQLEFEDNVDDSGDIDSAEALYRKLDYSDEANFAISSKDTASAHLKQVLSIIPRYTTDDNGNFISSVNKKGETIYATSKSYLNLPSYEGIDTIWGELLFMLKDVEIGSKLDYLLTTNNPKHNFIYNVIMSNPNIKIRNEFESAFNKQYADFVTIKISKKSSLGENNSTRRLSVLNTNRNNADDILVDDWYEDFLNKSFISFNDESGELEYDYNKYAPLYNNLAKAQISFSEANNFNDKLVKFKELFSHLNTIGVSVSNNTIDSIIERANSGRKPNLKEVNSLATGINQILSSIVPDSKDLSLNKINPYYVIEDLETQSKSPKNSAKIIKLLAKKQNEINPVIFEASFITGDGKSKYAFSNNTYLTHQFKKLKNSEYRQKLANTQFSGKSLYLNRMMTDPRFMSRIGIFYLDSMGNDAQSHIRNKQFKNMSDKEKEFSRISLYMNNGLHADQGPGTGMFISLINSDKTTHPVFRFPKFDVRAIRGSDPITKTLRFTTTDATFDNVYKELYLAERGRIEGTLSDIANNVKPIRNYHNGGKLGTKFLIFEGLNDIVLNSDGTLKSETSVHTEVKEYFSNFFNQLAIDQLRYWSSMEIDPQEINNSYYNKAKFGSSDPMTVSQYRDFAYEYAANQFIFMFNQMQLFSGDLALHDKKNVEGAWLNFFKRMAKDIAPGIDGNFTDTHFNTIVLKDIETSSDMLEQYKKLLSPSAAKAYSEMNIADAQEYTTLDEHIKVMKAFGRLEETTEVNEAIDRLKRGGVDVRDIESIVQPLQPMKPVYVEMVPNGNTAEVFYIKSSSFPLIPGLTKGTELDKLRLAMENHTDSNGNSKPINRAIFESAIKLGTKGEIVSIVDDNNSINLESLPDSEVITLPRTGFRIQMELPNHGTDGEITEGTQMRKLIHNNMIIGGESFINGDRFSSDVVKSVFNDLHASNMREGYDSVLKDLGFNSSGNLVDPLKLTSLLREEAVSKDYSINDINSIQIVNDNGRLKFKLPLAINKSSEKFQAILNSIITNRVIKQDLPGFTAVQGSSAGFKVVSIEDYLENNNENLITYINPQEGTKLKYSTVTKDSGKDIIKFNGGDSTVQFSLEANDIKEILTQLRYELNRLHKLNPNLDVHPYKVDESSLNKLKMSLEAKEAIRNFISDNYSSVIAADIIVPNYFKGINIKDYVNNGILDTKRLPEELLEVIGIRIPTQGHNSMMKFKVKGFLSSLSGEFTIVPEEIVAQMGSDFDVDKLFIYRKEYTNKDGILKPVNSRLKELLQGKITSSDLSLAERNNAIFELISAKLSEGSIIKQLLEPNGFGEFPRIGREISKLNPTVFVSNMTTRAQNTIHSNNNDGKVGVAVYSLFSTFNRKLQDFNGIGVNNLDIDVTTESGITRLGSLSGLFAINGNYKSNIISYLQSAAVDNAKEQILGVLNINDNTINVSGTMALLGLDEDYISYILAQPVIKDVVNRLKNNNDTVSLEPEYEQLDTIILNSISNLTNGRITRKNNDIITLDINVLKNNMTNPNVDVNVDILSVFSRFVEVSKGVADLMSALNSDSAGLGSTFASTLSKKLKIDKIKGSISNDLSEITNKALLFSNLNDPSVIAIEAINNSIELYSDIFDFYDKNLVNNFYRVFNMLDINMTEDNIKKLFTALRSHMLSNNQLYDGEELRKLRKELLYSPTNNIAIRFHEWSKSKEAKNNLVALRIKPRLAKNKSSVHELITVNTKATSKSSDVNKVTSHFYSMLNSTNPTTAKLAEDMVKYFYMTGGSFSPTSIGKYLNNDILEKYNFAEKVRTGIDYYVNGLSEGSVGKFLIQFFQNNPNLISKGKLEVLGGSYSKGVFTPEDIMTTPIFSVYDSNKSVYRLFVEQNNNLFYEIPVISEGKNSHYDYNTDTTYNNIDINYINNLSTIVSESISRLDSPNIENNPDNEVLFSMTNITTEPSFSGKDISRKRFGYFEGAKGQDILDKIIENKSINPDMIKVAQDLRNNFSDLDNINFGYTTLSAGYMQGTNMFLNVDGFADLSKNQGIDFDNLFAREFLHEMIHGATVYYLQPTNIGILNDIQRKAADRIRSLFKLHRDNYPEQDKLRRFENILNIKKKSIQTGESSGLSREDIRFFNENKDELYGYMDVYEFISEGLTNTEFGDKLKKSSLWRRLIEAIKRLIGIGKSDFNVLYDSVSELLPSTRPSSDNYFGNQATYMSSDIALQDKLISVVNELSNKFIKQTEAFTREFAINEGDDLSNYEATTIMEKMVEEGDYPNVLVQSVDGKAMFYERDMPTLREIRETIFNEMYNKPEEIVNFNVNEIIEEANIKKEKTVLEKFTDKYLRLLMQRRNHLIGKIKAHGNRYGNLVEMEANLKNLKEVIKDLRYHISESGGFPKAIEISKIQLGEAESALLNPNLTPEELINHIKYVGAISKFNKSILFTDDSTFGKVVDEVSARANLINKKLLKKASEVLNVALKEDLDLNIDTYNMIRKGMKDIGSLSAEFLDFSNVNSEYVQYLGYMIEKKQFDTSQELEEFSKEFREKLDAYEKMYGGSMDDFLQKDSKGNWTGNLLSKFSGEFYTKKKDMKFRSKNVEIVQTQSLKDQYISDRKYVEENHPEQLAKWDRENDINKYIKMFRKGLLSKTAINAHRYVLELPQDEWIDPKWLEIRDLPDNDPKKVLYSYIQNVLRPINKRYNQDGNFIPEMRKTNKELLLEGNVRGAIAGLHQDFKDSFENTELVTGGDIDSITGDLQMTIPVRYFRGELMSSQKSTDLVRIVEAVKAQEIALATKYETEPLLEMYQSLIQNSSTITDSKIRGEEDEFAVIESAPKNISEMSLFMIQNYLYNFSRDKTEAEAKYGKGVDMASAYIRVKGMGWNPFSAIGNLMQSVTTNLSYAAGNKEFNGNNYLFGLYKSLGTLTGTGDSKKIEMLYNKLDLQPIINELIIDKSRILQGFNKSKLDPLDPMYMTQRVELFNQSHTMISVLHNMKVTNKEGNTISVYEAFDSKGNWDSSYGENPLADPKKLFKLRMQIRKIIIDIHGNYVRPMKAKTKFYNRALLLFRTWLPQAINSRFGGYVKDEFLGTESEGRYKTIFSLARQKKLFNTLKAVWSNDTSEASLLELSNVRRALTEIAMIMTLAGIALMMKHLIDWDDLDDEAKLALTWQLNAITRAQKDVMLFMDPDAIRETLKQPIPMMSLVQDASGILYGVQRTLSGEPTYKTGSREGNSVLLKEIVDLIPFATQVDKNITYGTYLFSDRRN